MRHAFRHLFRAPLISAAIVVSLAVGIGLNTVVFSWIEHRVLRPLPGVSNSARLHLVEPRSENGLYPGASWREYGDLRERLRSFPELFAFRIVPFYIGETGRVERLYGMLVSDNYFSALRLQPALGRFFAPNDPHSRVVIISHGLWQSRYAGDVTVLGRALRVNGLDLTIVGVAPRSFQGTVLGLDFSAWVPATLARDLVAGTRELEDRNIRGYQVMGMLEPDTSRERAQAELDATMRELARSYPATNATVRGEVLRFRESPRGPQRMITFALMVLQAVMLLLLLTVCGNIANLVLARASTRQAEMGVRLALGAAPRHIAAILLQENLVLAALGAMLAIPIAIWGTQAFRMLPLSGLPIRFETSLDMAGLLFAVLLALVAGSAIGAVPALQFARLDPVDALRAGMRAAHRSWLRNALMGVQIALALVVLIVAGLFFRSFLETRDTDPGFRRDGVLLAAYDLTGRNAGADFARAFPIRVLDRLRTLPGLEAAAISSAVPLDIHGLPSRAFTVEGWTRTGPGDDQALANTVTPGYFDLLDIPLVSGTDFAPLDNPSAPPQAIVNEGFVRRYLPNLEPIGRWLITRGRAYVIAGIAKDSLYNAYGEPPTPVIYLSYRDNPTPLGQIHVRARAGSESRVIPDLRGAVAEIDADIPLFNVRTMTDHIEANLIFRRVPARLFAVLGPMLLALAALGVYAVVAYAVSRRTREIGMRLALGATPRRVVAECVADNFGVIFAGALAGWVLAFVVAVNFAADGRIDVPVFTWVPVVLLAVAACASWLPARRAAYVDPTVALREP